MTPRQPVEAIVSTQVPIPARTSFAGRNEMSAKRFSPRLSMSRGFLFRRTGGAPVSNFQPREIGDRLEACPAGNNL